MGLVKLENLTIAYSGQEVIRDLSFEIADGEIVSLLGPSGAGKSTLLKTIAGLLPQKSGQVMINDTNVDLLPAEKRDAVLIFQKPLLFPHLDVAGNISFGLKMIGKKGREISTKIARIVDITGLGGLEHRRIHQLSGGQQQRVALARGLVLEPSILLLDEPLSNLDAELRHQMRELIRNVQRKTKTTMLFVTHDQSEAFALSDRVCVMLDGTLRQSGSPQELFYKPADLDVARFFGITNLLAGKVSHGCFISNEITRDTPSGQNGPAMAVIRPEDIEIMPPQHEGENCIAGIVANVQFEGVSTRLIVMAKKHSYTVLHSRSAHRSGDSVVLHFPADRLHLLPHPDKRRDSSGGR